MPGNCEIQSWKYVCLSVIHQHDLTVSVSFPPLRLTLHFDFSRNYKNVSLKIKAASWRRSASDVICTYVFFPRRPSDAETLIAPASLCASPSRRRWALQGEVIQQGGSELHRPGVTGTPPPLCLWAVSLIETLSCCVGDGGVRCRGAVSRRHRLVWKISAISVSASGLMRTRGAEPGKGCSFVWVPISIKQQ